MDGSSTSAASTSTAPASIQSVMICRLEEPSLVVSELFLAGGSDQARARFAQAATKMIGTTPPGQPCKDELLGGFRAHSDRDLGKRYVFARNHHGACYCAMTSKHYPHSKACQFLSDLAERLAFVFGAEEALMMASTPKGRDIVQGVLSEFNNEKKKEAAPIHNTRTTTSSSRHSAPEIMLQPIRPTKSMNSKKSSSGRRKAKRSASSSSYASTTATCTTKTPFDEGTLLVLGPPALDNNTNTTTPVDEGTLLVLCPPEAKPSDEKKERHSAPQIMLQPIRPSKSMTSTASSRRSKKTTTMDNDSSTCNNSHSARSHNTRNRSNSDAARDPNNDIQRPPRVRHSKSMTSTSSSSRRSNKRPDSVSSRSRSTATIDNSEAPAIMLPPIRPSKSMTSTSRRSKKSMADDSSSGGSSSRHRNMDDSSSSSHIRSVHSHLRRNSANSDHARRNNRSSSSDEDYCSPPQALVDTPMMPIQRPPRVQHSKSMTSASSSSRRSTHSSTSHRGAVQRSVSVSSKSTASTRSTNSSHSTSSRSIGAASQASRISRWASEGGGPVRRSSHQSMDRSASTQPIQNTTSDNDYSDSDSDNDSYQQRRRRTIRFDEEASMADLLSLRGDNASVVGSRRLSPKRTSQHSRTIRFDEEASMADLLSLRGEGNEGGQRRLSPKRASQYGNRRGSMASTYSAGASTCAGSTWVGGEGLGYWDGLTPHFEEPTLFPYHVSSGASVHGTGSTVASARDREDPLGASSWHTRGSAIPRGY